MRYTIETHDLTKRFTLQKGFTDFFLHPFRKDEVTAVEEVNIKIKNGELFGVLGPNGAGKTTLIKMLCTLITPTEGTAYVNGYDIAKDSGKVRESIGFITADERSFYWRLTGRQNLKFFASLHNFYSQDAEKRIDDLLSLVGLENRADDRFLSYSAGMKQRMAIARGLLNDPEVLFMDEPTKALDPGAAQNLREFIKDRIVKEQEQTVFLSTHHLGEAEQLCDRIMIIDESKIKVIGTIEELKNDLHKPNPTLDDVFVHHTGKEFKEEAPKQVDLGRRGKVHGRYGGRMRGMRF
ncbi:ABC transporter ATP-binding protein [Methanococcoides sp.]|uniref:ABC transporter ATP-binding protein n=1 Tax=Methanococcoides sp. TaxID=1966350 RepID=UPI00272E7A94|nr:ABC transporter ATP-binding protein [Methanococcoides sp.]